GQVTGALLEVLLRVLGGALGGLLRLGGLLLGHLLRLGGLLLGHGLGLLELLARLLPRPARTGDDRAGQQRAAGQGLLGQLPALLGRLLAALLGVPGECLAAAPGPP